MPSAPGGPGPTWLSVDGASGEKFELTPQTRLAQTPSATTMEIRGAGFLAFALQARATLRGQVMAISEDPLLSTSGEAGAVFFQGESQSLD
jgi:hypothetical protein